MLILSINSLKGQQALSPGHRPGYRCSGYMRPERAKAVLAPTGRAERGAAFALTGRGSICVHIPRAVPWAKRACRGLPLGHPCPMRGAVTPTATEGKRAFRGLPLGHPCPRRGAVTPTATEGKCSLALQAVHYLVGQHASQPHNLINNTLYNLIPKTNEP